MAYNTSVEGSEESSYPTLVLMHFLGGSGREWDEVVALLGPEFRTLRVDLPGFGASAKETGYTVSEMADFVAAAIGKAGLDRYVLVGHSMSGKVAMVLARRAAATTRSASVTVAASGFSTNTCAPAAKAATA